MALTLPGFRIILKVQAIWKGNLMLNPFHSLLCFLIIEPDHFKTYFNKSVLPEELAEDFKTLRAILKSTPQFGNFLVGPDVTTVGNHSRAAMFLER